MRIPPLKIVLASSPLKSRVAVRRLAVLWVVWGGETPAPLHLLTCCIKYVHVSFVRANRLPFYGDICSRIYASCSLLAPVLYYMLFVFCGGGTLAPGRWARIQSRVRRICMCMYIYIYIYIYIGKGRMGSAPTGSLQI